MDPARQQQYLQYAQMQRAQQQQQQPGAPPQLTQAQMQAVLQAQQQQQQAQHQHQQQQHHAHQQQTPHLGIKSPPQHTEVVFSKPHRRMDARQIENIVPDAQLYKRLQETEKKLDAAILRKKLEIQDTLAKPIKLRRTLRIQVSSSPQNQSLNEGEGIPSWTLRIEGRLVDLANMSTRSRQQQHQISSSKFSHFVQHMLVELDRDAAQDAEANIIEYHKSPRGGVEQDGFEISRGGDTSVDVRITLRLDYGPDKYNLAPELADVALPGGGSKSKGLDQLMTKSQIVLALWQYAKVNKLQDTEDKRTIHCDVKLRRVFGTDRVLFPQVPDLIARWLQPPDPVVINYKVQVDQDASASYDVDVEVDDASMTQRLQACIGNADLHKEIAELDDKITATITALNNHKLKRDFLRLFVDDPVAFINQFVASQSRDLEIMLGDRRVNREEARRSEFYQQPWVKDAVQRFLASKVQ
ncbi:SWI/SNF and RSC complex subunit Ssr3 [Sorochytrium milnesiophthora]